MTARELLTRLLVEARGLASVGALVPRAGKEDYDVAVVATALLRKAYLQARAAAALVDAGEAEATIPNIRSLHEALGELNYLLAKDSIPRARVASIFARRELRDYLKKSGDNPAGLAEAERELEACRRRAPVEYELAMAPGRKWWTDDTRTDLVRDALESLASSMEYSLGGGPFYKLLSWDDHHVMASILAIDMQPGSPTKGRVVRWNPVDDMDQFVSQFTAVAFGGALKLYRKAFPEHTHGTPNG